MKQIRNFFSKSTRKKMRFRGECWGFMRDIAKPKNWVEEKTQN